MGRRTNKKRRAVSAPVVAVIVIVLVLLGIGGLALARGGSPLSSTAAKDPPPTVVAPNNGDHRGIIGAISVLAAAPVEKSAEATPAPKPADAPQDPPAKPSGAGHVVVIDAGHQLHGDSALEPIGPGSAEKKARVTSGTSGTATGNPEHKINLEVALKLKSALEAKGITVVMVRQTADVDISNSERAKIGNDAHADLVIRLHCDGSNDASVHGFLTLVPKENKWTGPIVKASREAAQTICPYVLTSTGAADRGIQSVGNMSGFNWSTVPTVIFEMGVMTNPTEDKNLADAGYQAKLAQGIAAGCASYLASR